MDTGNGIVWTDFRGWRTFGNAGTNRLNNFIGTSDNQALSIRTNNVEHIGISNIGNVHVGQGPLNPNIRFSVSSEDNFSTGIFNSMNASNQQTRFGIFNRTLDSGPGETGSLIGLRNVMFGQGDQVIRSIHNSVEITGDGTKYGIDNFVLDSPGSKFGILNVVGSKSNQIGQETGIIYGIQNRIRNTNSDRWLKF